MKKPLSPSINVISSIKTLRNLPLEIIVLLSVFYLLYEFAHIFVTTVINRTLMYLFAHLTHSNMYEG